jgi:hypothetical protein
MGWKDESENAAHVCQKLREKNVTGNQDPQVQKLNQGDCQSGFPTEYAQRLRRRGIH